MLSDVFERLDEICGVLPPENWMLVGGLMVHAHANLAAIDHPRPTDDADLVVELRADSYIQAARSLEGLGYERHEPIDHRTPFHRFTRGREHVDLMAPEGVAVRFAGRDVLGVPGSRSALKRTIQFRTPTGAEVRVPDLASALSLKGAAFGVPGINRQRHIEDAVTLLACGDGAPMHLSNSMRRNVNLLFPALEAPDAWSGVDPLTRRRALRTIKSLRPDWSVPDFLMPRRANRGDSGRF